MRKISFLLTSLIAAVFILTQCSNSGKRSLFNTDSLSIQEFRIDNSKDTDIRTLNGAIIHIPAGAFKSSNAVSLEIKEAYSVEDMLKAGLTTRSNGNILSSGGMFYINTKENAEIIKPISVALPGSPLVKEMKLYKGDQKGDSINWVNPTALPENPQLKAINTGHEIFINKCAACHSDTLSKDATGPALAHVTKRLTKEWLYAFTRKNSSMRASYQYGDGEMYYPSDSSTKGFYHKHDRYAECVFQKWNGIVMPNFTDMSDDELGSLYSYIENKSNLEVLPVPPIRYLNLAMDSCDKYQRALDSLSSKRERLIEENEKQTSEVTGRIFGENDLCDNCPPKVTPNEYRSMYYEFNITATGWYNIDVLLNELPGVQASELIIQVDKSVPATFVLYLIIPSHKVIADGGLLEGSVTEYGFYGQDGKCPLPQNVPAWIILVGEDGKDNIIFAKQKFTTSSKQRIPLQVSAINKTQFENEIDSLKLKEVNFKQTDSKNADEIRKTDKELKKAESLIPPGVDCSCGVRKV